MTTVDWDEPDEREQRTAADVIEANAVRSKVAREHCRRTQIERGRQRQLARLEELER